MMRGVLCLALVLAGLTVLPAELGTGVQAGKEKRPLPAADQDRFLRFEQQLDQLRTLLKIPGLSAAVLRDQEVVWAKGFGFASSPPSALRNIKCFAKHLRCDRPFDSSRHERVHDAIQPAGNDPGAICL